MKQILIAMIIFIFLNPSISKGADWEYFMQDDSGDSYYMDLQSIQHTSTGTVRLQRKIEPKNPSVYASLVSDIEMDCKNGKLKIRKETSYSKSGKSKISRENTEWQSVNPEGIDELLLELVCSLKKADN
jgi:hypothetical protein